MFRASRRGLGGCLVRCGLDLELGASRVRRPDFLLRRRGGRQFVGEFLLAFAEMAERAGHRGLAFPCSRQVVARVAEHPAQLRVARSEGINRRVLRVVLHVEARDAARVGRGRLIDGFNVVVSTAGGQHWAALEPPGGGRAHGVVPVHRAVGVHRARGDAADPHGGIRPPERVRRIARCHRFCLSLRCFFKNEMSGADLACSARQQLNLSHVSAAFFRRLD